MKIDKAKRIVRRLRRWHKWSTLPESDMVLLRSQAEANENVSFILAIMLFGMAGRGPLSWSHLWLLFSLAFLVFCRFEAYKFRSAMRLFEEHGPQMIEDISHKQEIPNK